MYKKLFAIIVCCIFYPSVEADVRFVKLISTNPIKIAPPVAPYANSHIAVQLRHIKDDNLRVRVLGYKDINNDGRFSLTESITIIESRLFELKDRLMKHNEESRLLPISQDKWSNQDELEVIILDKDQMAVMPAIRLTINAEVSNRSDWLKPMSSLFIAKALRIYDTVRNVNNNSRTVYRYEINGKHKKVVDFNEKVKFIDTSNNGEMLAVGLNKSINLVKNNGEVVRIYSSGDELIGLHLINNENIIFVHPRSWGVINIKTKQTTTTCDITTIKVNRSISAKKTSDSFSLMVKGYDKNNSGIEGVYELYCEDITQQRLASDPRYELVDKRTGKNVLYVYGNNPKPGIYAIDMKNGHIKLVVNRDAPLYAVAKDNGVLYFVDTTTGVP